MLAMSTEKQGGWSMYTALYRSFRPETFDGILGQEHIVKILKNQIKTETTVHAYLFCGTRGTGKTSTARILAKAMNCLAETGERPCGVCANCLSIKDGAFMDVIEIDAASNNGVDNIRELRESVKYPPAAGRCKVYIIDEVHMLSTGAFNALLKTLEEPPENVMFILATTEVQKLPATILSRCLRLDFKRVPERILKQGMRDICSQIEVRISDAALGLIASNADGSVRDALSLLDQCISTGDKTVARDDVIDILGTAGEEIFVEMTELVLERQIAEALLLLDRILQDGKDVRQFMKDWIAHFRSLLMTKFIKNPEEVLNMSSENVDRIRKQSEEIELGFINDSIVKLSQTLTDAKWSTQPRILLELCIVKLASDLGGAPAIPVVAAPAARRPASSTKNSTEQSNAGEMTADPQIKSKSAVKRSASISDIDCDRLWHAVFEDGEALKGSFNLLRVGTKLKEVCEDCFYVEASNEMMETYIKENSSDLEMLMEKHTGRKLRLECTRNIVSGRDESGKTAEDLADEIGNKFGIHIEIQ
ncbi:DNA polymerase III subunit gamma/tau [Anoxybacterium hadale]|uniref:DNA polymerase III subunit gamma/tau n=1 Tax=Anoxybacterium hadale TaxID=3408580 RepID=A0ACD1ABX1_9FIRM|nr:DNA polymerase III subunit gamma/tau [Clostridiales bacterium]